MILELIAAGVALGSGLIRQHAAKERFKTAFTLYNTSLARANEVRAHLEKNVLGLGQWVEEAFGQLASARRILRPFDRHPKNNVRHWEYLPDSPNLTAVVSESGVMIAKYKDVVHASAGLGTGAALAIGTWGAVSILGSASTGTAIATLHGVAATNAALAWLGGGSLATGGGGIVAGHLALTGIVVIPAAAMFAALAHLNANKINTKAAELDCANQKNRQAIATIEQRVYEIMSVTCELSEATGELTNAVRQASRVLFRYGWFSRLFRQFRYFFGGSYYTKSDMPYVTQLQAAVQRFMILFSNQRKTPVASNRLLSR
jgi:hypothetical protein